MTDPKEWYAAMPPVTKTLLTGGFVTTLAGNFGVVSPYSLILDFGAIWNNFEIWRLATGVFFFGKLGFPFLINMYFLYSYSVQLEQGIFNRRVADYVYMVLFVWLVLLAIAWGFDQMIIGVPLVIAILYTWCQGNPDMIVSFWFGTRFPAMYLPWVLCGFNVLLGGNGMAELIGIFAGHCYFFLKTKYPRDMGGPSYLDTPRWLEHYFPPAAGPNIGGFGTAPAARGAPPPAQPRTAWGRGQRLGDQ